jgi:ABC-2 type transport system ATP-binding protein
MIEVRALCKRYRSTLAVDDLTFTVRPGAVTGFLGPNGAGKSTTMRMILGLDRPCAGEALIAGRRYAQLEHPLRAVGALLDAGWVHPRQSARAHLRWLARAGGLPAGRVADVLGTVGLTAVADQPARTFSLGMRQRLGIAAALLGDPAVLLFDEPVNGLDPEGVHWFRTLVQSMAAEGRTVLVSSHLLAEMALTATELVVIGRGRLVAQGSLTELAGPQGASLEETYLRLTGQSVEYVSGEYVSGEAA